jgi:excisionase family DNA binding protein
MPSVSYKPSPTEVWWDYDRTAERLGVSRSTIRRMCRDGQLPTIKVRGAVRIPRSAVYAYETRQINGGAA